jgi:hypothetical protein
VASETQQAQRAEPGAAEAEAEPEPALPPSEPVAKTPAPVLRSEETLLREARKRAVSEPEEALKLLDEHAARFANGLLVPEREVLAIETLRRLERTREANKRLERFKARYPSSMHLRRLTSGAREE